MKQSEMKTLQSGGKKSPRRLPLKIKLICAFLLFTAVMLIVLWVFQTVFLDDFYQIIKKSQIRKAADHICAHIEDEEIGSYLEDLRERNSTSAGVYDTTTEFFRSVYSNDSNTSYTMMFMPHEVYACYEKAKAAGGEIIIDTVEDYYLGSVYGENFFGEMPDFDKADNDSLTCVKITKISDGREYMVVLRSPLTPVTSTVETLRVQLLIITAVLAFIGVAFAVIVSANISRPLAKANKSAKELARQNYDVNFSDSGYKEIQELNETLNFARKELSAVDGLRRELVANISHDLRTPLTMISGYAEVMRDIPGENSPENLQVIIDESQRLSQLVTDLLDLSKLESGSTHFNPERFCLTDSVRSIFTRYAKLISTDGYNLQFECAENVEVIGDEIRLSQVIYNLINNAINYSGEDKTVVVRQILTSGGVRIEITDKGEGIDPDDLKNIWDRYYRVDKEHRSAVIGTGLGLSIAKNILLQHNARFGVKSAKGVGSTFWFELRAESVRSVDENNI